jgi:16S rRNA (cytidine1402-2'-O)-methyltransferase
MSAEVFLIPISLHEDETSIETIPTYVLDSIKQCQVYFAENEKTARRYFKKLWREMVIDDYQWFSIHKAEEQQVKEFLQCLKEGKKVGIISEAGCPGIADPGQILVHAAQSNSYSVKPLVGPSSILLALMASGMNGQLFQFNGYLPIDSFERKKKIRELESNSSQTGCTHIFIETPYRNNALIQEIVQTCNPDTKFCIASEITGSNEFIKTKKIRQWKTNVPDLHKKLVIYLLQA